MAASKKRADGLAVLTGLHNLDPNKQKPVEEKPAPEPVKIEEPKKPTPAKKRRAPGRPRKFNKDEETVVLGIRVKKEEASFLEIHGGKYGGKTGYVTHLIREEMKRIEKH